MSLPNRDDSGSLIEAPVSVIDGGLVLFFPLFLKSKGRINYSFQWLTAVICSILNPLRGTFPASPGRALLSLLFSDPCQCKAYMLCHILHPLFIPIGVLELEISKVDPDFNKKIFQHHR